MRLHRARSLGALEVLPSLRMEKQSIAVPRDKPAVRTQRLGLPLPWGLLGPLLPQGDRSRWGGVFSTVWLSY